VSVVADAFSATEVIMNIGTMLKGHDLFKSFPPDEVDRLTRHSSAKILEQGETIYTADQAATHVFVLLDGEVHLRLDEGPGPVDVLVSRVKEGELFGLAPLIGCARYSTRADAARASKVLYVEARPLIDALREHPAIGHEIMSAVARAYFERYKGLMERVKKVVTDLSWEA